MKANNLAGVRTVSMASSWRFFSVLLAVFCLAAPVVRGTEEEALHLQYKRRFDSNVETISAERVEKRRKVHEQYRESLVSSRDAAQQTGQLEQVLLVIAEIERFDKLPAIPTEASDLPPRVQKLATHCLGLLGEADVAEARQIVTLAGQYEGALAQLMQNLTRQGKMDEALAVRQEIAAVKADDRAVKAREIVARAGTATTVSNRTVAEPAQPKLTPRLLPQGLVAHWSFDGGDAKDEAGGFNGFLAGDSSPQPVDGGIVGGAASFNNRSRSRIEVPDAKGALSGTRQTVTLWLYMEDTASDIHYGLVEKLPHDRVWCFLLLDASKRLFMRGGAVNPALAGRTALKAKQWYFCAAVWDGKTGRLYLDGVLDATGSIAPVPTSSGSNNLLIGCTFRLGTFMDHFDGILDEVQYYNRALSAQEIRALHAAGVAARR